MKIIAISDLHGKFPEIPPCDLLIIAGDLCPDGFAGTWARTDPALQQSWFERRFLPWLDRQPAKEVILTWGNHDYCGERCDQTDPRLLVDAERTIGGLRIWATPWSNQFMDWAWMKRSQDLAEVYAKIPAGIDILVSHQPPRGCGDRYPNLKTGQPEHVASAELLAELPRIAPKVVICGHLHGGFGLHVVAGIPVYNVSVLNEAYQMVNPVTELNL